MTQLLVAETEFKLVAVKVPDEAYRQALALVADRRCTGCRRKVPTDKRVRCGMCGACYQQVIEREKRGEKAIRRKLIQQGKMLPQGKGGRPTDNPFVKEIGEL